MNDNEHVTAIRGALTWLRESIADTENARELGKTTRLIHKHLDDISTDLAEANARAGLQLERAERLAEAIMGLCEGDANDIEFELDLYPLDLYDQTADLDAAPSTTEGETQP